MYTLYVALDKLSEKTPANHKPRCDAISIMCRKRFASSKVSYEQTGCHKQNLIFVKYNIWDPIYSRDTFDILTNFASKWK